MLLEESVFCLYEGFRTYLLRQRRRFKIKIKRGHVLLLYDIYEACLNFQKVRWHFFAFLISVTPDRISFALSELSSSLL